MKKHQSIHEDKSEKKDEKEKILYTCEVCGKKLSRKTHLNDHKKKVQTKGKNVPDINQTRLDQSDDQCVELTDKVSKLIESGDKDLVKEQNIEMNISVEGKDVLFKKG